MGFFSQLKKGLKNQMASQMPVKTIENANAIIDYLPGRGPRGNRPSFDYPSFDYAASLPKKGGFLGGIMGRLQKKIQQQKIPPKLGSSCTGRSFFFQFVLGAVTLLSSRKVTSHFPVIPT